MPKTADEMLVELRKTHTELENELRDAYVEFQNHGAAEAEFLAKKLRQLAKRWNSLTRVTRNTWRHKNVRSTFSKN